jgi:phosphoheptose isomerase
MGFLADKRILITGVLSKHSIAYGIARARLSHYTTRRWPLQALATSLAATSPSTAPD